MPDGDLTKRRPAAAVGTECGLGPSAWSDQAIVVRIGNLLRAGVLASTVFILLGGGVYLFHHGRERVALPDSLPRRILGFLGVYRHPAMRMRVSVVDRSKFEPMPPEFSRPGAIVRAALVGRGSDGGPFGPTVQAGQGRGRALIQFGLLLLIATPVLRVAFSIFAFARQRDLVYVFLPAVVLLVLIYGLFSGQMH